MAANPAVVQREMDALRGSSPAELESLRVATATKLRLYFDSLPEVADVPEAAGQIKVFTDALQARLDAIARLTKEADDRRTPPELAVAPYAWMSVESTSHPATLFTPTPAATAAAAPAAISSKTVLILGALSLAALLILMRKP